ncbi:MAG: DegV family protein [Lachnospiraceae bacterium]|nr:DegV family protein [Lachnospiraceae bacterium]
MSTFKLITDSTADLPQEYLDKYDIGCIKMTYTVDGQTYGGTGQDMDWKEFYRLMREEGKLPTTSQINPDEFKVYFEDVLKNYDEILYLAFSSGLSGTYNSALIAADMLKEEYPNCRIRVVDSLCASMGEGLFVHKAQMLKEEGKTMDEVADWLNQHVLDFAHLVTVDDLFHLHRGGRVSKSTAIIGTLAGIKPILHVDNDGHLVAYGKVRGRKKSLLTLVDMMEERIKDYPVKNDIVFISHGDALEDAEFVKAEIQKRFGIEDFMINNIGPTVGSHSGPGTIALFFLGTVR